MVMSKMWKEIKIGGGEGEDDSGIKYTMPNCKKEFATKKKMIEHKYEEHIPS